MNMSNNIKSQISPMYLHKAQNPRACHIYRNAVPREFVVMQYPGKLS